MRITQHQVWKIGDTVFYSRAKAQDHVDGLIYAELKRAMLAKGFSESEAFKATECVLALRTRLADLLTCEFYVEDGE